jgi:hypothetical protein
MSHTPQAAAERQARGRYAVLNLLRLIAIGLVLLGIAIARGVVPLPAQLPLPMGAVLAVAGLLGFFFLPPLLARRWKAADRARP